LPRYQQTAAIIRDRIRSRELAEGDAIPSQKEIQDQFGVARATAAKALRVLTDEGIVVVVPGVGARVAGKRA
jgi:DNA-binding GntR family transcriptional regulator